MLACISLALVSCRSIFEEEGNCKVVYKLKFVYDYNLKWADATAHEVNSVRFFAFDASGKLAYTAVDTRENLVLNYYTVFLPPQPGNYRIVAWCGADNNPNDEHFDIARSANVTESDLTAYMHRKHTELGAAYSDVNLHPLYYGAMDLVLEDKSAEGGEYVYILPLMKDTNKIKIVLQQLSGIDISADQFDFRIVDENGSLAADNSLVEDELITYIPWETANGKAGVELPAEDGVITQVQVAIAEFTVNRMMLDHRNKMMLEIRRKSDMKKIISIPVIDYALLVKSFEASNVGDQEYLDRQDEYSMLFFIDDNHSWASSMIYINSWRVVLQNHDLTD